MVKKTEANKDNFSLYECGNEKCTLYKTPKEYFYEWLKERPVCSACKQAPALLPIKSGYSIKTAGCSPVSQEYTH